MISIDRKEIIRKEVHAFQTHSDSIQVTKEQREQVLSYVLEHKDVEIKIISGVPTSAIASGIIDVTCRNWDIRIRPKTIAKKMNVNESTVRIQSKKIQNMIGIVLKDRRTKRQSLYI
tara:strand:+ start:390 stop:740 length:351 start_codon:yes stop_codon:yes gene_type:complete